MKVGGTDIKHFNCSKTFDEQLLLISIKISKKNTGKHKWIKN